MLDCFVSLPEATNASFHVYDPTDDDSKPQQVHEPAQDIIPDDQPEILVDEECLVADPIRPTIFDQEPSEVIHLLIVHIPECLRSRPVRGIRQVPPFDDRLGPIDDRVEMVILIVHADVRGFLPGEPRTEQIRGQPKVPHPILTGGQLCDHQFWAVRIIRIQHMRMHLIVPLIIRPDRLIP